MTVQSDQFDLRQPAEDIFEFVWRYVSGIFDLPGQLTFFVLLLVVFILFILRLKKDLYLWRLLGNWVKMSVANVILITVLLYTSPLIAPPSDEFLLYRILHLRLSSFLLALTCLSGGLAFLCSFLPTGMIQKIEDWPPGPTIVITGLLVSLAYIISYS